MLRTLKRLQIFAIATQEGCFSGWLFKSQKMLLCILEDAPACILSCIIEMGFFYNFVTLQNSQWIMKTRNGKCASHFLKIPFKFLKTLIKKSSHKLGLYLEDKELRADIDL